MQVGVGFRVRFTVIDATREWNIEYIDVSAACSRVG